ncbi:MAG: OmpA family protein, partial [Rhodospirillaceae bacterium]|nr:OmpA family protein [Rhodospirillaceae bacterium]
MSDLADRKRQARGPHRRTAARLLLGGLALGLALAGCAERYDVARVQSLPAPAEDFSALLFEEYIALAQDEIAEADWRDAARFLERAEALSNGVMVEPELLADRDIEPDALAVLTAGRFRLTFALDRGGRIFAPTDAAIAQGAFDCWMQEQEENFQPRDIGACQNRFLAAMTRLEAALQGDVIAILEDGHATQSSVEVATTAGSVVLDTPGAATLVGEGTGSLTQPRVLPDDVTQTLFGDAIDAEPERPDRFILYFEEGLDELTQASTDEMPNVLQAINRRDGPRVDIVGHAVRVGPEPFNAILSRRRAELVRRLIVDQLPQPVVTVVSSYGEQDPLVPTADEVAEPRNR